MWASQELKIENKNLPKIYDRYCELAYQFIIFIFAKISDFILAPKSFPASNGA